VAAEIFASRSDVDASISVVGGSYGGYLNRRSACLNSYFVRAAGLWTSFQCRGTTGPPIIGDGKSIPAELTQQTPRMILRL